MPLTLLRMFSQYVRRSRVFAEAWMALHTLRGQTEPADVQQLELVADLLRGPALAEQPLLLLHEDVGERGVGAARRVAGAGLQEHGAGTADGLVLEALHD